MQVGSILPLLPDSKDGSLLKALNENGQNLLRKGQQKDCECVKDSAKKETIDPGVVTFQWLIVLAARVLRAEKFSLNAPLGAERGGQ